VNSRSEFVDGALPPRKVTVEFDGPAAEETGAPFGPARIVGCGAWSKIAPRGRPPARATGLCADHRLPPGAEAAGCFSRRPA